MFPSRTLLVAVPHVLHVSFYTISSSNTVLFGENILLKLNAMFVSMGFGMVLIFPDTCLTSWTLFPDFLRSVRLSLPELFLGKLDELLYIIWMVSAGCIQDEGVSP